MKRANTFLVLLVVLLSAAFPSRAGAAQKIKIFVSILPQRYFVEKIGGKSMDINVMVAPHQNPENFEPLPSQMAALSKADVYFAIGVPFEETWLEKFAASCPGLRVVHTDEGITKKPIQRHEKDLFSTGADSSSATLHHAAGLDPHVWLSPPLVMIQARHIRDALVAVDPDQAPLYEANYKEFTKELNDLDREIKTIFASGGYEKKFLVLHPSWGYFADAYGLTQLSIEMEGKEPKAREVKDLIAYATRNHLRTVFVQPQFSSRQAEIIAQEMNGRTEVIDPLAPNWAENLLSTARAIRASFDSAPGKAHE